MSGAVYLANQTFACELDGEPLIIHRGITRVREGHPLQKAYAGSFDLIDSEIEYDIEEATAPPARPEQSTRIKNAQKAKQANQVSAEAVEVATDSRRGHK